MGESTDQSQAGIRGERHARSVELYSRYSNRVYWFLRRRGCSESEAEDLTQEVFLRVLKKRDKLPVLENPLAWLKRIAVGTWANWLRDRKAAKRGKRERSLDQHLEDRGEVGVGTPVAGGGSRPQSPDRRAAALAEIEAVKRDLATLPPKQRQVLRLVLFGEFSYDQAARALKVSVNTIKSHVSQGRKKLRELRDERDQRRRS